MINSKNDIKTDDKQQQQQKPLQSTKATATALPQSTFVSSRAANIQHSKALVRRNQGAFQDFFISDYFQPSEFNPVVRKVSCTSYENIQTQLKLRENSLFTTSFFLLILLVKTGNTINLNRNKGQGLFSYSSSLLPKYSLDYL